MPDGSLNDVERRVANDRAALARSLDLLSDTLAPDRLKEQAAKTAQRYGAELGGQAWQAARENPAAFSLVGAGLALLLSGAGRRSEGAAEIPAPQPEPRTRSADRTQPSAPSAGDLRAALHRGLETLPPEARARVTEAREAAISAQEAVERRAAKATGQANRVIRDNPVAAGAAAFGVGALAAMLIPATRREDELLGARRDAVLDHARKALDAELADLRDNASEAPGDARRPDQRASASQVAS